MVHRDPAEELWCELWQPGVDITRKMNAIFGLKEIGTERAVTLLCAALLDARERSVLVRHEIAYVLGQIQSAASIKTLTDRLIDTDENSIVRHECGEALGAVRAFAVRPILQKLCGDAVPEVRETCVLALERLRWLEEKSTNEERVRETSAKAFKLFETVDPAPAFVAPDDLEASWSNAELGELLLNENEPLFRRYRALFTLRDRNTDDTAGVIAAALRRDTSSALFRHEVAYVLGQMSRACTLPALESALADTHEHAMVRHEAAEAIGAIGNSSACDILRRFLRDADVIVRESCQVALDIAGISDDCQFMD
jgi:deoxyhypusine monooxygenase